MAVATKTECPRSPDSKHKFDIGGRVYRFCAYCYADIDTVKKEEEVLKKVKSLATKGKTESATEETETDKIFEALPPLPSVEIPPASKEPDRKKRESKKPVLEKPSGADPVILTRSLLNALLDDIDSLNDALAELKAAPKLPEWDEIKTCGDVVKVKWLEVFQAIATAGNKPE